MMLFRKLAYAASSRLLGKLVMGERAILRVRLAAVAMVTNVLSKALGFLVLIYSTRVALEQLGPERFGVWVTISSAAVLMGFLDFGVSNALIGRVAELSAGRTSDDRLPRTVTAGLVMLVGIGFVVAWLLAGVFALAPIIAWFKGISGAIAAEARLTGYVFAVAFGASLSTQAVFKIYIGIQRGWIANLASASGWVVSLFLIALAPKLHAPMWFYLFATYGVQQVAGAILSVGLVRRGLIKRPPLSFVGANSLRNDVIYKQGKLFFVIQIAFALSWGANQFILSAMMGPAAAGSFSVLQRLFMLVQVPLTIFNLPLWSMYADALAHHDIHFIRDLLKRSLLTTLIGSVAGVIILMIWQSTFLSALSAGHLEIGRGTVALMALWTVVEACGISYSMYLNGVGRIRPQAVTGVVQTMASLPIKALAVHYFGLNGMVASIALTYAVFTAVPFMTIFRTECLSGIITD